MCEETQEWFQCVLPHVFLLHTAEITTFESFLYEFFEYRRVLAFLTF